MGWSNPTLGHRANQRISHTWLENSSVRVNRQRSGRLSTWKREGWKQQKMRKARLTSLLNYGFV